MHPSALARLLTCTALTAAGPCVAGVHAAPAVIDFEGLSNGLDVESTATPWPNLSGGITSSGPNLGAAIFDSNPSGPNAHGFDPDLLVGSGNILIVQSEDSPGKTGSVWDTPNDEAGGGTLVFDFDGPVTMLSILLIDIDLGSSAAVSLFDAFGGSRVFDVPGNWTGDIDRGQPGSRILDLTTLAPQPGFDSIATAADFGLDVAAVTRLSVGFGGSAGLDDVTFAVPAPGTLALAVVGLAFGRRRRRQ